VAWIGRFYQESEIKTCKMATFVFQKMKVALWKMQRKTNFGQNWPLLHSKAKCCFYEHWASFQWPLWCRTPGPSPETWLPDVELQTHVAISSKHNITRLIDTTIDMLMRRLRSTLLEAGLSVSDVFCMAYGLGYESVYRVYVYSTGSFKSLLLLRWWRLN
jgi:hypothetical protein